MVITKGENILFSYYFWVITKYADSSIQNLWQICEEFSGFERKFINQLHVYICFMSIFIHYSFFKIESKIIFQYLQYQLLLNNLKSTAIQRLNWNKWHKTTNVKWTQDEQISRYLCSSTSLFILFFTNFIS